MEKRAAFGTTIDLPGSAAARSDARAQHGLPSLAQLQAAACASGEYALRLEAGRWHALRLAPAAQPAARLRVPAPQAALVSGGAKVSVAAVIQNSTAQHSSVAVPCRLEPDDRNSKGPFAHVQSPYCLWEIVICRALQMCQCGHGMAMRKLHRLQGHAIICCTIRHQANMYNRCDSTPPCRVWAWSTPGRWRMPAAAAWCSPAAPPHCRQRRWSALPPPA